MNKNNKLSNASRRMFVAGIAAASAAGVAIKSRAAFAQDAPKAPAQSALPTATVANSAVMAEKYSGMQAHSESPLTASVAAQHHHFAVTPTDRMFVRNHLLTPDIDAAKQRLTVKGLVHREVSFSVEDLRKNFPLVRTQAMLECAGSGRTAYVPQPGGTPWFVSGGMGCPVWNGVRLRDVLRSAGLPAGAAHVAAQGGDFGVNASVAPVIRSIPLDKAMEPHTMLVFGMNDGPLPRIHGHPLRLLVPGWAGSASAKWLHTLTVLDAPFNGTYMDTLYRMPRDAVRPGEKMPRDAHVTEAWPVKSIITYPAPNAAFKLGRQVLVEGRAWVGEGAVAQVDLSFDEGITWQPAQLNSAGDKYAWRIFSFAYRPTNPGYVTALARATDDRGNVQPLVSKWNPLGYFWNGVHRVGFMIDA